MGTPVAFGGLRKILRALEQEAPAALKVFQGRSPAVWNRLFPGSVEGAPDLGDLALTPSERRLHRESEQTFWILNASARALLDGLAATGRPLVVRNAGLCDLVSLRALMRAAEWSRIASEPGRLVLADWSLRRRHDSVLFSERSEEYREGLLARMRATVDGSPSGVQTVERALDPVVDLEGAYLKTVVEDGESAERRIAAAILAMRACFFSTNYEGVMLAAEHGLALLDKLGSRFEQAAVVRAWEEMDETRFATPAIEVDRGSLGDADELRALFYRQIGVVRAFTGGWSTALSAFQQGLDLKLTPERRGQLRMFRALTLIKRLGMLDQARAEIEDGLSGLRSSQGDAAQLHEGWLRNVYALTYFQEKKFEPAMQQEKLAMKCVGDLHEPSATHLKINLISNVSVLQESARQFPDSVTTWRRFEKLSSNWGINFRKHHSYRLAGLNLKAGQRDEAVQGYMQAHESALLLGDAYHGQAIAGELGRFWLDGKDREKSVEWFTRAVSAARDIGDPLHLAESLAGLALAKGENDFREPLRLCTETTTHPAEGKKLAEVLASGDASAVQAALPSPRTKLNRPFDLVNLM